MDPGSPDWPLGVAAATSLAEVDARVVACFACPRLVAWREEAGRVRRPAYADQEYWARPVPSFGDVQASVVVVGLAPAAHGGNRTGRMFTGDRSGDFLVAALHRTGFANQAQSERIDDGLTLTGLRMVAPVHCAPPDNSPTPDERHRCAPFLGRELELLAPTVRVAVVLGAFGWLALLGTLIDQGWAVPRPRLRFGHGAELALTHPDGRSLRVLGCFHVSPHNTNTGRLTPEMLDAVLERARSLAAGDREPGGGSRR